MNVQASKGPPTVTVAELNDITAVQAGIELVDQDAVQLQSMPLRARRVIVRLGTASVMYLSTNLRVRTRTTVRCGLLAYVAFGPQSKGTLNGLQVRSGVMAAAEPGAEGMFVVDGGWESVTLLLPPEELRSHMTARGRASEFRVPHGVEMLHTAEARARALFDWGKRLASIASREPRTFDRHAERAAAHVELIELLLSTLRDAQDLEPGRSDRARQGHSQIVKIAEDHALSQVDAHLYVSDLCKAAGVSERTLEYAFKDVMGLTPVAYLIRLRLHRVRQGLLAATQGTTTVSIEALRWGFWHFGEFARAYKDCFGERPSDTLRRTP